MDAYRTVTVYGSKTPDASYTVTVNGQEVDNSQDGLFSFITNTTLHGSCSVVIKVQTGSITLTNFTATYPALINNIEGTATFVPPIKSPVAVIRNNTIEIIPFNIDINKGTVFVYEHLLFNGPTRFNITTKNIDLFTGMDLYIGDFLTQTFNQNIVDAYEEHNYSHQPDDLSELLKKLTTSYGRIV